ncbi:MAG: hypothetical protein V3U56_03255 [Syntrophobacteria bacterium]
MSKESVSQTSPTAIQEKIEQAHMLYSACGDSLRQNPSIHALLNKLQECIDNTNQRMLILDVVAECKRCEEEEGGSCCGAGIENKYDVVLLLTNLLLGRSLENGEPSGNSCYFLGEYGCLLTARHVLCVNYICKKLQKKLTKEQLISLQTCAGEELDTLFILHEAIKKRMRIQFP